MAGPLGSSLGNTNEQNYLVEWPRLVRSSSRRKKEVMCSSRLTDNAGIERTRQELVSAAKRNEKS